MDVTFNALLPGDQRDEIAQAVQGHRTLSDVVLWATAHRPPLQIADVVVQDEYTHDVVVPLRDGEYLVYDTT